jgi:hypothetical protein
MGRLRMLQKLDLYWVLERSTKGEFNPLPRGLVSPSSAIYP